MGASTPTPFTTDAPTNGGEGKGQALQTTPTAAPVRVQWFERCFHLAILDLGFSSILVNTARRSISAVLFLYDTSLVK
jgi:hypothetical protein